MTNLTKPVTESELAVKLSAPRVTVVDIENAIAAEFYIRPSDFSNDMNEPNVFHGLSCLTICVLVLQNGFTVTGTSACASTENYDEEIVQRIARQAAVDQIWPLLGYQLRDRLAYEKGQL